jgi:hypothetical protein
MTLTIQEVLNALRARPQLLTELLTEAGVTSLRRGACPLCEHRDAFSVDRARGLFHCFRCEAKGDALAFYQAYHGVNFPTARDALAARVGITPGSTLSAPAPTRHPSRAASRPQSCHERLDAAACVWAAHGESLAPCIVQRALLGLLPLSEQGREYLAARRLCPDTAYGAGVRTVDDWRAFAMELAGLGAESGFDAWNVYVTGLVPPARYRMPDAEALTVSHWLSPAYARGGVPALLFIYRDVDGTPAGLRFRALAPHEHKALSARRVDGLTDPLAVPFGAELLRDCAGHIVHIAEGEPDTLALRDAGALAVGLPGTVIPGHRSDHPARWMLALRSARAVCLWTDADPTGEQIAQRLAGALRVIGVSHIRRVRWPARTEKDANDLLRAGVLGDTMAALEETL